MDKDSIDENNYIKLNINKCYFLIISGNKIEHVSTKTGNSPLWDSSAVEKNNYYWKH